MGQPDQALIAIGRLLDSEIDIADAALQIARTRSPKADWRRCASHLSELAREAASIAAVLSNRTLEVKLGALTALIHARHGYAGDRETYDDLANADLIRVIERRRGLPVSLGILWLHCIRAAGWHGHGIDMPRHFLIRLYAANHPGEAEGLLIDVFAAGQVVTEDALAALTRRRAGDTRIDPSLLRPMSNREVLLRLERNIVERQRAAGLWIEALTVLEGMSAIAPEDVSVWQDQAVINQHLGRLRPAIDCLQRIVDLMPDGMQADRARAGIDALRRRLV